MLSLRSLRSLKIKPKKINLSYHPATICSTHHGRLPRKAYPITIRHIPPIHLAKQKKKKEDKNFRFSHNSLQLARGRLHKMKLFPEATSGFSYLEENNIENLLPKINNENGRKNVVYKLDANSVAERIRQKALEVNLRSNKEESLQPQIYCKKSIALGVAQMPILPCKNIK